jgi:glycosyltransferase involved in cell wall biosynthesis
MIDKKLFESSPEPEIVGMPLVSIVTPAYNAGKFIEETLSSIQKQDYPNFEHIVLNDGSTDNTPSILERFQRSYNLLWVSKSNEGQAVTVNKGFRMARGEIIVWLNADDVLFDKQVITNIVKKFQSNPDTGVIYGHTAILDENSKIMKIQFSIPWLNLGTSRRAHVAPGVFYRRSVALRYTLDSTFDFAMDYEQTLRMCNDGVRFGYLNKVLIGYRRHRATKSMSQRGKLNAETKRLREKYGETFGISYVFLRLLDDSCLLAFKLLGIKTVIALHVNPQKAQLAFDAKFDSMPKLILRQAVPYVS